MNIQLLLQKHQAGVKLPVCLNPRSSQQKIEGIVNGELKIKLNAPPVDGAANQALLKFLSGQLQLPLNFLTLLSGHKSKHKIINITGLTPAEIMQRLNLP